MIPLFNQLPGMFGGVGSGSTATLFEILSARGINPLGTTLRLCLDAGDANSYSATNSQKWLDTSGEGEDFFFGGSSSVHGTDPSFHGTVGGTSSEEYMVTDGGEYFTYDTTMPLWMQSLHKTGARWSIGCLFYLPTSTSNTDSYIFGTCGQVSNTFVGLTLYFNAVGGNTSSSVYGVRFSLLIGSSIANSLSNVVAQSPVLGGWNFIGSSLDTDTANNTLPYRWFGYHNGVTSDLLEINPTTVQLGFDNASSSRMRIFSAGYTNSALATNGTRIAMLFIYTGVSLTALDFTNIYNDIKAARPRFNLP